MNPDKDMIIRILTVNMDKRIARYGEGVNFSIFKKCLSRFILNQTVDQLPLKGGVDECLCRL
jgi:hypothetical protein